MKRTYSAGGRPVHRNVDPVTVDVAQTRALAVLDYSHPLPASAVADAIWPGHEMAPQGAGAAASRILVGLRKKGLARWTPGDGHGVRWGWVRTAGGAA